MKTNSIVPIYVDVFPKTLEAGKLYISRKFKTAAHLCCCGCGNKVITPLKPGKWNLTERGDKVSLSPSVGNWSFSCESHYWITNNSVDWSQSFSKAQIAAVRTRDGQDIEAYYRSRAEQNIFEKIWDWIKKLFS